MPNPYNNTNSSKPSKYVRELSVTLGTQFTVKEKGHFRAVVLMAPKECGPGAVGSDFK